jgi:nitroimidazol reductase NimA-like FMN-containing flavoprotein (pyridoxamine 5'-phosphate oxidase superfamily)
MVSLSDYGIDEMTADEVDGFLASASVGVLGLPTGDGPVLRPMSFWYDGDERLYLLYVLTDGGRKVAATDDAGAASFLVYRAETPFNWRSVFLTGTVEAVPEAEREAVEAEMELSWRPDVLERAATTTNTRLYAFDIVERTGREHLGLPSGMAGADEG